MVEMRIYRTGFKPYDLKKYPAFPYETEKWQFAFIEKDKELIIGADSIDTAYDVMELLYASISVIDPDMAIIGGYSDVTSCSIVPDDEEETKELLLKGYPIGKQGASFSQIPAACMLAVAVADKPEIQMAMLKLCFSHNLLCYLTVDLDPTMATEIMPKYYTHWEFILASNAIVNAYSSIEELGLEVKASKEKPSRPQGSWNPKVKSDLEERLLAAGVDLSWTVNWDMRGDINPIDEGRPTIPLDQPWWCEIDGVRDENVEVIDAIADSIPSDINSCAFIGVVGCASNEAT